MTRFKVLILLCFFGYFSPAQKHLIRFNNITIDNGLAQGSVTGIVHGSDGFIWIATADGLHRYDGYTFKIYRNIAHDNHSLPDNYISCLYEDKNGYLILGFYSGEVARFNKSNSKFELLKIRSRKVSDLLFPVNCITQDENGNYLIGYEGGGLVKYGPGDKTSKTFLNEPGSVLPNNIVKTIVRDEFTGNFWIGTASGMIEYVPEKETLVSNSSLANLNSKIVTSVKATGPDRILIGTHGSGIYEFKRGADSAIRRLLPKSKGSRFISFILKNTINQEIWIGTLGGVYKILDDEVILYNNNPLNPESLVDNNTQSAIIDRFGSTWIGTINGLSRFDPRLKLFNLFREFRWKDSLLNNNVYHIYEDTDANLWMGTLTSGILKFNPKTEEIKAWPVIQSGNVETKMVRCVFRDRSGQMWIGSRDAGLFKFDENSEKFTQVKGEKGFEISGPTIKDIFEDREGKLWIGTANGLNLYNRKENTFELFRAFKEAPNNNNVYQIEESRDGRYLYLACFRGGFQIFDKQTKTFRLFADLLLKERSSGKSYAMCFELIEKDSVMIGTYGGGLFIMNLKNGGTRNISEKQGLANNSVYGILKYKDVFWLSTNRGLSCFNKKTGSIRNFGLKNYIQSNEFNEGAYCKTSDGMFYFGGVNGFNYFDPGKFLIEQDHSITEITSIKKGNEEIPVSVNNKKEKYIYLNYNDNLISFEFATLNFIPSQSNRYAYKLEGFDDNWIISGTRTTAYYTKLAPGNYIFRVKAMVGDSLSKDKGAELRIYINPPFWRTWWFYTLILMAMLGLIYLIIKWRTQIIDQNYKHKLAELELKALRSQMNPHFIFNSLNSIQYFILKKEPKAAYNYLTKFSSLMRMILQNSKHKSISLKTEYDWLKTYLELENLRMEGSLIYEILIEPGFQPEQIYVPTMVLQPYVENAIIHGLLPKEGERKLSIRISAEGQNLKCIIEDNGIGRARSNELNKARLKHHESTAMNLTKDRLAIMNIETGEGIGPNVTDLFDENGKPAGTRVEILLPLILQTNL